MTSLVVLLCAVSVLNLVLTLGVIRRLRAHSGQLAAGRGGMGPPWPPLPPGARAGAFTAVALDGGPVSRDLLSGRTLVGFFSPGCPPCEALLPAFTERAKAMPEGRALAVIQALGQEDARAYAERLSAGARVVVEGPDGPLAGAFQVRAFPSVFLLDADGVVVASGLRMDDIPDHVHGR